MKKFVLLFLVPCILSAQIQRKGDLLSHIDSIITAMPNSVGGNAYQLPTSDQRAQFKEAFSLVLQQQYSNASILLSSIGYHLLSFEDTTEVAFRTFYIIEKHKDSSHFWGTYVVNPAAVRPSLNIQSPHELFDTKTGGEGAYIFFKTGAFAFFLNGTHRCDNATSSSCSGTTTACSGVSEPFKISDEAHNTLGLFQAGTEVLLQYDSNAVVVQLHGFGKGNGDPDLIMGNGTTAAPTGTDYLLQLKNNLSVLDDSLTFKVAHIDTNWTELTGTTNTQGRLVNKSSNPCNSKATTATGRFLHIEQAYPRLRDTKSNWNKIVQALLQTFPAVPVSVREKEIAATDFVIYQNYPNPFNPTTVISYQLPVTSHVTLKIYDALGREVATLANEVKEAGNYSVAFDAVNLSSGIYFTQLQCGNNVQLKKMMLLK